MLIQVHIMVFSLCLHTGYIQASRALMIAAIVFGGFGLVATLVGMKCSKIGGENYVLKGRITAIGGVFFLLQGKDLWMDVMAMQPSKLKQCGQKCLEMYLGNEERFLRSTLN